MLGSCTFVETHNPMGSILDVKNTKRERRKIIIIDYIDTAQTRPSALLIPESGLFLSTFVQIFFFIRISNAD